MNSINDNTVALIKHYESLNDNDLNLIGLQPKMDCTGIWTEGYGHALIDPINKVFLKGQENEQRAYDIGTLPDEETACELLDQDLKQFAKGLIPLLKVQLNDNQFGALLSLAFNCGVTALTHSIIPFINANAYDAALHVVMEYCNGTNGKLPGLYARRLTECNLFRTGQVIFYNVDEQFKITGQSESK